MDVIQMSLFLTLNRFLHKEILQLVFPCDLELLYFFRFFVFVFDGLKISLSAFHCVNFNFNTKKDTLIFTVFLLLLTSSYIF